MYLYLFVWMTNEAEAGELTERIFNPRQGRGDGEKFENFQG